MNRSVLALATLTILAGCSSNPPEKKDEKKETTPATVSFTYHVTGIKGQPGFISDD